MNCAVHTQAAAAAFCRTCGKALCEECKRDVRGVIYCEDCIVAGLQHTQPSTGPVSGFVPAAAVPASGPNPTVAGIIAFFFPFGLGAVYNGEYAKGLTHMVIFALLVAIRHPDTTAADVLHGLAIAFFYFYQLVDAVRSARAKLAGQPTPDPLGVYGALGMGGGSGAGATGTADVSKAPIAALVLIGLGVLFLLRNMGVFYFGSLGRLWPLILIAIGIRMFQKRGYFQS
jgi:hypothetical protein